MYKETTICICIIILIIWLDILTQNYTKTSTIEITECLSELKKEIEQDRLAHGKKPLKDKNDYQPPASGGNGHW